MLSDASGFVQSLDSMFGGFREKADRTYELLKRPAPSSWWSSAAEPDALREASFFVDRLSQEKMPLAGLILNRTHPMLCDLHADKAIEAAEQLLAQDPRPADGGGAADPRRPGDRPPSGRCGCCRRFTGANPHVAIVGVPSLPFDVSDLEALRAIADQLTGAAEPAGRTGLSAGRQTALRCLRWAAKNSAQETTSGCCLSRARR